jgi:hypothetical protein
MQVLMIQDELRWHDRWSSEIGRKLRVKDSTHHMFVFDEHHTREDILRGGHCFWLESTAYGRAEVDGARRLALSRKQHFWVLPLVVDSWFSENPAQSDDQRSTGGVLTALRQAPCALAPVPLFGVE